MAVDIHVADEGTSFRATVKDEDSVVVDVSDATDMYFRFKRPDQTTFDREAEFVNDGTDGLIEYITVEDDLNQDGSWRIQAVVTLPTAKWHSEIVKFRVDPNL